MHNENAVHSGIVKSYNSESGFGFVDIGEDVDVLVVADNLSVYERAALHQGLRVRVQVKAIEKGFQVTDLKVVGNGGGIHV